MLWVFVSLSDNDLIISNYRPCVHGIVYRHDRTDGSIGLSTHPGTGVDGASRRR